MKFKFKLEWYLSIKIHCLAPKKGPTHAYISLDRLWLRHTFAVALFWQAYEMSHHWFPSRVCQDPCRLMCEVFSSKILCGVKVWTLWWPVHVWKWCLMLPKPVFHNLSLMNRGIVILEYDPAIREEQIHWKKLVSIIRQSAEPRPDQLKQPQIITLPLQACTVGTGHEWCITSSASLLTLICPSLWNRWNLDSSDLRPLLLQSPVFMRPSRLKPFFPISLTDK